LSFIGTSIQKLQHISCLIVDPLTLTFDRDPGFTPGSFLELFHARVRDTGRQMTVGATYNRAF